MPKQSKASRVPGRRWLKRSDYIFLGFLLFLVIASCVAAHLPRSAGVRLPQPVLLANGTLSVASSQTSSGGNGGLPSDQGTAQSSSPAVPMSGPPAQTAGTPSRLPVGPRDIGDDWLIGNSGLLGWTDPGITSNNPQIKIAWGGVLGMADLLLVLFIMINGIRISLGGVGFRYADALEALPRTILAFAAAHLSLLFVALLIDLNNALCQSILVVARQNNLAYTGGLTITDLVKQGITLLIELIGWILGSFIPYVGEVLQGTAATAFIASFVVFLIDLTLMIFYLFLAIQLLIRIALINLLLILAPLGFASWALPQGSGQGLTRIWLNATFASILVQFLQLTCYTFGLLLLNPVAGLTQHFPVLDFFGIEPGMLFKIATLWITLRVPGLVQNVTTQTMGEGSRSMASMIGQTLGVAQSAISTVAIVMRMG